MANLDDQSSVDTSVDSQDVMFDWLALNFLIPEENSTDSRLHFSEAEETLIILMHNLVGERWPLIAGRIPGRTAEEIEKYWTSRYSTSE
ncbi:hypothetical protein C5167_039220 [Papaver somniferum]|uniref:Uncharacterized protein n=1 Tax=Papaver somniferum TaxID=3469 RepID=A0A4Y7IF18_PAPSO|nr:hypothetical protein C5167_039220 [Papaver somniferum]